MRQERISYKTITVLLLFVVASLNIVHTLIAKHEFHDASLRAQKSSLSRIIDVAAHEIIRDLRYHTYTTASTLQKRLVVDPGNTLLEPEALRHELDDLFINGFVGARSIDLVDLRVYDPALHLVAESTAAGTTLPHTLPPFLLQQAQARRGADRFKTLGGLWRSPPRPLYSLLLPIGGLQLAGYLEVIVDPAFNLSVLPEMTRLPIRITTSGGKQLFASPQLARLSAKELLPVDYQLNGDDQQPLYHLTGYEDITAFSSELQSTQLKTTLIFIISTLLVLSLVLLLLNRFLFRPVNRLIVAVQNGIEGDLDTTIDERGVREVHLIAHAFNTMAQTIRNNMTELQRISSLDSLTGIANRRVFDIRLEQEWARAMRHPPKPLALMVIDIDYFKRYNDALGHQAGDHALREVAQLLASEMKRPTDLLARYGGEEFVVLLPETDRFGAGVVALKIKETLGRRAIPHPDSAVALHITLSIGINVVIPSKSDTPQQLLERADQALYEVKRSGRNDIAFAPERMHPQSEPLR